ncbi:MAG: cytochrome c oxidase subunit 3 [Sphingomonadaceae bacterium]|uniref:cytochrome c oxidase subunit 3 n=1 Tax=Thermaurantiacus sp. TaxID=2820283 RepID=UPI00298F39D9|nr:cytochrome c oxidase subunit 3 [Thermaurantiacus sp.]MCS6987838.1 cytochrome c oxidase subunit 3 [Sphingomonadaceae bacterium]MDW8414942.1 cytochrome c oxidase subunit 3 [Thermaurantiacus sp.]
MAAGKTHDFHILPPSPWPIVGSVSAILMTTGFVFWWHDEAWGKWVAMLGVLGVLFTMFSWWTDVRNEANAGFHTPVVQLHHRYGMLLFIASEVMFFVAWFWAFFNAALYPPAGEAVGGTWPPKGIEPLDPFVYPLLNTLILLLSGTTITWAHHALIHGDRKGLKQGLWLTIGLGVLFTALQAYEYAHAEFGFSGNIYGATFFMATGFHGFHVIVGTIFLAVCLWRAYLGDFTPRQHFGFEAAAWYWHFVDVVWLFLFLSIYIWGSDFGRAAAPYFG